MLCRLKIIGISKKTIDVQYDTNKETLIWEQWCDCSKAKRNLGGWHATTPIDVGLSKVYKHIKKNCDDYK